MFPCTYQGVVKMCLRQLGAYDGGDPPLAVCRDGGDLLLAYYVYDELRGEREDHDGDGLRQAHLHDDDGLHQARHDHDELRDQLMACGGDGPHQVPDHNDDDPLQARSHGVCGLHLAYPVHSVPV